MELWDAESLAFPGPAPGAGHPETGALVHLQFALNFLARTHLISGELSTSARLLDEQAHRRGDREPAGGLRRGGARRAGAANGRRPR